MTDSAAQAAEDAAAAANHAAIVAPANTGTAFTIPSNTPVFTQGGANGAIDYNAERTYIMENMGYDPLGQLSPSATAQPGSANYGLSREYYTLHPDSEFNSLIAQYATQHSNILTESSGAVGVSGVTGQTNYTAPAVYDTSSAAGIAAMLAGVSGGVPRTTSSLIDIARTEGYTGPALVTSGISTMPTITSVDRATLAQGAALTLPESALTGGTLTLYGPGIGAMNTAYREGVKVAVSPLTGEISEYTLDPWGNYGLIGGAGRYAAQSGEFSVAKYNDTNTKQIWNLNLDTISPFYTENLSKSEAPGADIPWHVSSDASALLLMDQTGIYGSVTVPSVTIPSTTFKTTTQIGASEPATVMKTPSTVSTESSDSGFLPSSGELFGIKIPVVSDIISYFSPTQKTISTNTSLDPLVQSTTTYTPNNQGGMDTTTTTNTTQRSTQSQVNITGESPFMQSWESLLKPATYVNVLTDVGKVLDIPYEAGFYTTHAAGTQIGNLLPSEVPSVYFATPGTSTAVTRTENGTNVYLGNYSYTGPRPYLDVSTPLNAIQNLGSIAAGKGAIGNYTVASLNPIYLQTDKEMLAQQKTNAENPNVLFSDVLPLKMDISSATQGLWDKPITNPVEAAMYYGMPIGFGVAEDAAAMLALRSSTISSIAGNFVVRNTVQLGMDAIMADMVTGAVAKVPGYDFDVVGGVTSSKPFSISSYFPRSITGYSDTGESIYAAQNPQATGQRAGGTVSDISLMYLGGITASRMNLGAIHETNPVSPSFMDMVHGKAANILDAAFTPEAQYNAANILRMPTRTTDLANLDLITKGEIEPQPLIPEINIQNVNGANVISGIQSSTGVPSEENPLLTAQGLSATFRDKLNQIDQIFKLGTARGANWDEHAVDIGKNVYGLKSILTEMRADLNERVSTNQISQQDARAGARTLSKYENYVDNVLMSSTVTVRPSAFGDLRDYSIRDEYTAYAGEQEALRMRTPQVAAGPDIDVSTPLGLNSDVILMGSTPLSTYSTEQMGGLKVSGKDVDVTVGSRRGAPETAARAIAEAQVPMWERAASRAAPGLQNVQVTSTPEYTETWLGNTFGVNRGRDITGASRDTQFVQDVNARLTRLFGEANQESFSVRGRATGTDVGGVPVTLELGTRSLEDLGIDFKIRTSLTPKPDAGSIFPYYGFVRDIPSQEEVPFTGVGTLIFGSPQSTNVKTSEYRQIKVMPPEHYETPQVPLREEFVPTKSSQSSGLNLGKAISSSGLPKVSSLVGSVFRGFGAKPSGDVSAAQSASGISASSGAGVQQPSISQSPSQRSFVNSIIPSTSRSPSQLSKSSTRSSPSSLPGIFSRSPSISSLLSSSSRSPSSRSPSSSSSSSSRSPPSSSSSSSRSPPSSSSSSSISPPSSSSSSSRSPPSTTGGGGGGWPDLGGVGPSGGGSNSGFTFTEKLNVVSRRQALIGDRMNTMTGLGKQTSKKNKMF